MLRYIKSRCVATKNRKALIVLANLIILLLVVTALGSSEPGNIIAKDPKTAAVVESAMTAIGGEKKINAVTSLVIFGTSRSLQSGGQYTAVKFEYRILLPDNILFIDIRQSGQTKLTFFDRVLNGVFGYAMHVNDVPAQTAAGNPERLASIQNNNVAIILLGTIMRSSPVSPLNISAATESGNMSTRYNVAKLDEVFCDIEFDQKDKYPSSIRYKDIQSEKEYEAVFKGRSSVDGLMFPRVITYEALGVVERELTIEKVLINQKLTLEDFEFK